MTKYINELPDWPRFRWSLEPWRSGSPTCVTSRVICLGEKSYTPASSSEAIDRRALKYISPPSMLASDG